MFVWSKLLSAVTQPVFWLALWWCLALCLLWFRRRTAVLMLWLGLAALGGLGFQAGPDALLRALESRYAVPPESVVSQHAGVIVLGGALDHPSSFVAHDQVPLGEAAERMTVPVGWMRAHAHLRLVFSGGEGRLLVTGVSESDLARRFYADQGLDMNRVRFEGGSRNTRENAQRVAQLLGEGCSGDWLLVTSAWHMPRSMAEFEAVGCRVTPYPVDFRTGESTPWSEYSLAKSLMRWQTALHEYLGWWVYRLTR
ncbi:MAG: hypothetical protein RL297_161 [Pseudomonadota bacterium]|jgi:uncharacterized SAM-binding protein YcdF (DUF218 family)